MATQDLHTRRFFLYAGAGLATAVRFLLRVKLSEPLTAQQVIERIQQHAGIPWREVAGIVLSYLIGHEVKGSQALFVGDVQSSLLLEFAGSIESGRIGCVPDA
jgi:hypothetical protein